MPSQIVNKTRKTVLGSDPRWMTSSWQQMMGLRFCTPKTSDVLVFLFMPESNVAFDMFFVFGPIDIIALDGTGKVIALRENFSPWTVWNPGVVASAVIELPVGAISMSKTVVGDSVTLPPRKVD